MKGIIKCGEMTLLEDINLHVDSFQEDHSGISGLTSWSATFDVPKGGVSAVWTLYDEDGPFLLILEDGSEREVMLKHWDNPSVGSTVTLKSCRLIRPAS